MTLTALSLARSVQILGLVMAGAGIFAVILAPQCGHGIKIQAGVLGGVLDIAALAVRRWAVAVPISILKLLVVVPGGVALGVMCAPVLLPAPPIPVDVGPLLIAGSAVPSVIGALWLRFAR